MPPKFSLQNILEYHHHRVEMLEMEVARLLIAKQQVLDSLSMLFAEQNRLMDELVTYQIGVLDLQAISLSRAYLKQVQVYIAKLQEELKLLEEQIENARMEVVKAKQDEAVYEKLREREWAVYEEKVSQMERRMQDDIYTSKAHTQRHSDRSHEGDL